MGPTAIAHVRISVSVAPRYRLSVAPVAMTAERSGGSGPVRYCLASNGRAPALPVALMWQPAGQEMGGVKPAELRVSGLANCTKEDGGFRGLNAPPTGLVILRPE
jgi:hypothetical protein